MFFVYFKNNERIEWSNASAVQAGEPMAVNDEAGPRLPTQTAERTRVMDLKRADLNLPPKARREHRRRVKAAEAQAALEAAEQAALEAQEKAADDSKEEQGGLVVLSGSRIEPSVAQDPPDTRYQFERRGYFVRDPDSTPERLIFNRTVTLRDTWAKVRQKR